MKTKHLILVITFGALLFLGRYLQAPIVWDTMTILFCVALVVFGLVGYFGFFKRGNKWLNNKIW